MSAKGYEMETPYLDQLFEKNIKSELELAVLFYGDRQTCSDEDLQRAEEAAAELAAYQARVEMLEGSILLALNKLRSTTVNWQEQCLFDCNDILAAALQKGE